MLTMVLILILLILLSAFFSSSETAMMSLNRYRIRHKARKNHSLAKRVWQLIERPDRLLGVIITGNTFANILGSSIATVLCLQLFGDYGIAIATFGLTVLLLIFGEITPKTLAALYPEKLSYFACWPLFILLKITYPLIWSLNFIANNFLRIFGIHVSKRKLDYLSSEELRTVLHEASLVVERKAQNEQHMMIGVLDLSATRVDDIKVPRQSILGIDWNDDWDTIVATIRQSELHRMPVYEDDINQVIGILNLRDAMKLLLDQQLTREKLRSLLTEAYFIPEGTSLKLQLYNFRHEKMRMGLIVDEFGDIQGLITLDDILEEIVGEFTTNITPSFPSVIQEKDGSYLLAGELNIRELNRQLEWNLPVDGPNTLSGMIIEHMETIPEGNVCLRIAGYPMEVVRVEENRIKLVKVYMQYRI